MEMTVFVATHKEFDNIYPEYYKPILVGSYKNNIKCNYLKDNTGDNISEKNDNYCELTGLYWIWKNTDEKYIGLCHYRRYFSNKNIFSNKVLNRDKIIKILEKNDIILPERRIAKNTIYEHYCENHYKEDLDKTKQLILRMYPEYINSFNIVMNSRASYSCNMFISKRELINEYLEWLFSILFELENELDISNYDDYQKRIFGFISERLMHIWVHHNKLKIKELPVIMPDMKKITIGKIKLKGILDKYKLR